MQPTRSSPLSQSDRLPFNSFHLAAEYNLYHLQAHLTSSLPLSSPPLRPSDPRSVRPVSVRSAPVSACPSEAVEEDSRAALFTSRCFHSSAACKPLVGSASSSAVDGGRSQVPKWYYEDQLRRVVEQMDRSSIPDPSNSAAAAPTPPPSPVPSVPRPVGRSRVTIHRLITPATQRAQPEVARKTDKRVRVPTPVPARAAIVSAPPQQRQSESSQRLDTGEWEFGVRKSECMVRGEGSDKVDEGSVGGLVSVGMDVRRVKLLEMALLQQQQVDQPRKSQPVVS